MTRPILVLLALSVWIPGQALARRAALDVELGDQGTSSGAMPRDEAELEALSDSIGPSPSARRAPPHTPTTADVRAALGRARAEIATCLETAGFVGSVRVDARIETSRALTVTVTPRPVDPGVRACADLAAQRQLANVAAGNIRRTLRGSITVRRRGVAPPPPPHPRHPRPPSGADAPLAGSVRARLDQDRGGLLQCLSSAAPGVVGQATLRVTLQPDGSLVLSSASLPPGIPAGPALPCLSARIGTLRFAPAPSRPLAIEHTIELGL
jgi:hypothetical protein